MHGTAQPELQRLDPRPRPVVRVGPVPVDPVSHEEALERIEAFLDEDRFHHVATCNLNFLRCAEKDPGFLRILERADLVTADGTPLLWLARCAGSRLPGRVTGSDLLPDLLRLAGRRRSRVFLLGGAGDDAFRLALVARRLAPGMVVAGVDNRRVDLDDRDGIRRLVSRVAASRPDIVLVAYGSPKSEHFLAAHGPRTGCRLAMGIGAAFAFSSGTRARAPRWLREHGLEWLHRLLLEPRRLGGRYLGDAAALPRLVLGALGRRFRSPSGRRTRSRQGSPRD